jgi:endonuclease YncB( thermonuclease family)
MKMNVKIIAGSLPLLIAGGLFAFGQAGQSSSQFPICEVIPKSVHDGDTVRVNCGNGEIKVRFACVDAPELKQPFGVASRDHLRSLINESQGKLKVQVVDTDRYGRSVALLQYSSQGQWRSLQESQARAGTVWAFERFKRNCPNSWNAIATGAAEAKRNRRGLWASGKAIAPWEWRKVQ